MKNRILHENERTSFINKIQYSSLQHLKLIFNISSFKRMRNFYRDYNWTYIIDKHKSGESFTYFFLIGLLLCQTFYFKVCTRWNYTCNLLYCIV